MKKQIKKKNKSHKLVKSKRKVKQDKSIDKRMTFAKIMKLKPEAALVLMENGMHCFGCSMSGAETLEQGALAHGLDADKLVKEINKESNK